jgi:methylglutaconyl-CoA hydratase
MSDNPVQLDISAEGVALVLINRPAKRNAFDEEVIAGLKVAFDLVGGAAGVRVMFLRGAGAHFSAGADLDWMRRQGGRDREDNEADAMDLAAMLKALYDLPCLTVAMVKGAAIGGGAGLVAACDVAVALEGAQFRFSEVRLGLTPATISPYVVEAIGPRWAKALFASAVGIDARQALAIGLVHHLEPDEAHFEARAEAYASAAFANAPGAVEDAKTLVRDVAGAVIDAGLMRDTAKRIAARRESAEGREGLSAFLEKRKPDWDHGS